LSTVERVMQFVSAHLYRAETRSAVAEAAWAAVTSGDADLSAAPDDSVVGRVSAARARAVEKIAEGAHPTSITESALRNLDHAIYAALAEARVENVSPPASTATVDAVRREHRS
jgi:hypothetical protein